MPDSGSHQTAPDASRPGIPPPDQSTAAPHPSIQRVVPHHLKFLRTLATLEGVPGLGATVLAILIGIASWKGMFDLFLPSAQAVGGGAIMVFEFLRSSVSSVVFAAVGLAYLIHMSQTEENTSRAVWLPIVGWLGMIMLFCTIAGSLMFIEFVQASKIPDVVAYYEKQTRERFISNARHDALYSELRKVASSLPAIRVSAVRDPEAVQYGRSILLTLREAGIKTENDINNMDAPFLVDVYSTDVHGIYAYAKQTPSAQSAAASLRAAFAATNLELQAGLLRDADTDPIDLMIGYR